MGAGCSSQVSPRGHHEVEILGRGLEAAAESGARWRNCGKNPGHGLFMAVPSFLRLLNESLPEPEHESEREFLTAYIALTVRIRVQCTSLDRPENDVLAQLRGSDSLRVGTGFITRVRRENFGLACKCPKCNGETGIEHWQFRVATANHVVYNEEEMKETKIDLFYDEEECLLDGRMVSVKPLEIVQAYEDGDTVYLQCYTHDKSLYQRLWSTHQIWKPDSGTSRPPASLGSFLPEGQVGRVGRRAPDPVMIASHPHGQPKKITLGRLIDRNRKPEDKEREIIKYTAGTCPGSSGALVITLYTHHDHQTVLGHCGSETETAKDKQVNYSRCTYLSHKRDGNMLTTATRF